MQFLVASLAVAFSLGGIAGYLLRGAELRPRPDLHCGPDDVERRARRVQ